MKIYLCVFLTAVFAPVGKIISKMTYDVLSGDAKLYYKHTILSLNFTVWRRVETTFYRCADSRMLSFKPNR